MKEKITTVIILFFLTITTSYCQDKAFLKSGKTINGKIIAINQGKVYLKVGKKTKKFGYKNLDKVIYKGKDQTVEYKYREIPGVSKKVLLGELVSGKATLYRMHLTTPNLTPNIFGGGYGRQLYFLITEGKEKALKITPTGFTTRSKKVENYLSDCKSIVDERNNGEWKYNDLIELAETYNSECSN